MILRQARRLAERIVNADVLQFGRAGHDPSADHLCSSSYPYGWPTWQVVSPGRSGTLWLADLLLATTPHGVVHAAVPTLAEVGYAVDEGSLNEEAAWGAYLQSRLPILDSCRSRGVALVDLDCKSSPLVESIMRHNSHSQALIMLRRPEGFIRSGLSRGYFRTKAPFAWGHLSSLTISEALHPDPTLTEFEQAVMIARFWNRVAQVADRVLAEFPQRASILPLNDALTSKQRAYEALTGAGIYLSAAALDAYRAFGQPKNASRGRSTQVPRFEVSEWKRLEEFATEGISSELLVASGIVDAGY